VGDLKGRLAAEGRRLGKSWGKGLAGGKGGLSGWFG